MPDDTDPREPDHEPTGAPNPPSDEVAAAIILRFPAVVFHESHGQPVLYTPRELWHDVATCLRDEHEFTQCLDVTAVDHLLDVARALPAGVKGERYEVVANFLSHPRNRRIRTISELAEGEVEIASITDLYPGVGFGEREVFDLFGVTFTDHPDLTRILMPDDWVGHPLRKDDSPARVPVAFKQDPGPR